MILLRILPLLILLTSFATLAGESKVVRLSEPVEQTATHETFGAELPDSPEPITLAALLDEADRRLNTPVTVAARVSQVCQKKGCFFIAQADDRLVRVSFKDYGFFVPTDIGGKDVTLAGILQRIELSPQQAAHYQSDLGSDASAPDVGWKYELVATSVRVPR